MWMGDLFVISGLCEKRAEIAGRISELERTTDQLRAELIHVDAVLRLFRPEIDLETIPEKTRKAATIRLFWPRQDHESPS